LTFRGALHYCEPGVQLVRAATTTDFPHLAHFEGFEQREIPDAMKHPMGLLARLYG
jgi:hypothetical protein